MMRGDADLAIEQRAIHQRSVPERHGWQGDDMWRREKIALSWGLCMLSLISAGAIASASSIDPARQAGRKLRASSNQVCRNGVPNPYL